ncbi:hypothetical protein HN51_014577 [Arachis hypogaea]|uniref:Uncharacterized protein n=1 Tax=Arachis hypogaea TaxID=3818 RepID=A0A445CNW9_ARAHY|nr:hypothetical protein Ahy_A06g027511 [Arachis hypogaea]
MESRESVCELESVFCRRSKAKDRISIEVGKYIASRKQIKKAIIQKAFERIQEGYYGCFFLKQRQCGLKRSRISHIELIGIFVVHQCGPKEQQSVESDAKIVEV